MEIHLKIVINRDFREKKILVRLENKRLTISERGPISSFASQLSGEARDLNDFKESWVQLWVASF